MYPSLLNDWRSLPAAQQPLWPDEAVLGRVTERLAELPPLVHAADCERLKDRLSSVARGEAFLLQGGDCAESLDGISERSVRGKLDLLQQMSAMVTQASGLPVVKVGRLAGQYAKPRSSSTETRGRVTLPAYRGDAVNGIGFSPAERTPDAERLLRVYHASAYTLEVMRDAAAPDGDDGAFASTEFFVSHEGLLLDYEAALTRVDDRTGRRYATSGHLLWIGDRTRDLGGAHVEFFSRISNPIAVKLGPTSTADTVRRLIDRLDPEREPGRLTLMVRIGADRQGEVLPELVAKVSACAPQVAWVCDPMHGNTVMAPSGRKTRRCEDVLRDVGGFSEMLSAQGVHPGGVHLELTAEDVTECVDRHEAIEVADLTSRYESLCDPRLNRTQSLDLARATAAFLAAGRRRHRPAAATPRRAETRRGVSTPGASRQAPLPSHSDGVRPILLETAGLTLSGLLAEPADGPPRATVVAVHGGGMRAGYFDGQVHADTSLLALGARLGFTVLALDRPGYGRSAAQVPAGMTLREQSVVLAGALDAFSERFAVGKGFFLLAHSYGAKLALATVAHAPSLLALDASGIGHRYGVEPAGRRSRRHREWERNWGPLGLYPSGTFRAAEALIAPTPAREAAEVDRWPEMFEELAPRIDIPLRLTFAEHESWWLHDEPDIADLRSRLIKAPLVRVERQPDAGHNISLGRTARCYHLRALAFFEECLQAAEETRAR
jgi:3-deoxy-7-phosphoheptulonate synthase